MLRLLCKLVMFLATFILTCCSLRLHLHVESPLPFCILAAGVCTCMGGFYVTHAQLPGCDSLVGSSLSALLGFRLFEHHSHTQLLHPLCLWCHPYPPTLLLPGCCLTGRQGRITPCPLWAPGFCLFEWVPPPFSGFCEDIGANPPEAIRPRLTHSIQ